MKVRNILMIVGLLGLALVIILNIHQLKQFVQLVKTVNILILLLIILVQLLSYYLNALYYRSILNIFGSFSISTRRLFEGAMAANFVNYLVPTAGVAGAGFMSQALKPEVPRGRGVLVQIMRYALSALAALIMIPIGLSLVIITRPASKTIDSLAITASLAILAFALAVVALVNQETWLRAFIKRLERRFKRLFSKLKPGALDDFAKDFYVGYHAMVRQKKRMLVPFGWSIIYILVEMFTLYLAFLAFRRVINPGVVIVGYLVANISSIIGGSLFSVGVFELGMLGTFVALGEPFVIALSITILYRVVNLLVGLPPGFVFYRRILAR